MLPVQFVTLYKTCKPKPKPEGPSEICTQSTELRLAVSGGQTLFTLELLMFTLSSTDFLSLLWSPSTNIDIFDFCQKYHLKDTHNIFKKSCWFKIWMGFVGQILSWELLPFEVFFSCLCDVLLGVTYANMLVTTQWPLKRAPHLTSLVWVCVVWTSLEIAALWIAGSMNTCMLHPSDVM